jgi:hypothetical protein
MTGLPHSFLGTGAGRRGAAASMLPGTTASRKPLSMVTREAPIQKNRRFDDRRLYAPEG